MPFSSENGIVFCPRARLTRVALCDTLFLIKILYFGQFGPGGKMLVKTPPKGMRDILPRDLALRQRIMDIIKEVYTSYGFTQIETPCVEDIKNLTSKQGGDNEKLIFKILKRGEKLENATADELCDLGLRYDLTVPLSRYYANNAGSLPYLFKAFQIGIVCRAELPQKG